MFIFDIYSLRSRFNGHSERVIGSAPEYLQQPNPSKIPAVLGILTSLVETRNEQH